MRFATILLLVSIPAPFAPAGSPGLKEARRQLLRGEYEESAEAFKTLLKDSKTANAAAIGLSKALEAVGEYDQASSAIESALTTASADPGLWARLAELHYLRGRWADAEKAANKALASKDDHYLARWVLGQVYRDRGEIKKADEEFRTLIRAYNANEVTDPEELLPIGLAATERARWHNLSEQFPFVLNEVYGEALKQDKNFWWAEYQAGRMYLEKYNRADASKSFDRALIINPRAAEVFAAKAEMAYQRFEMKDAEFYAKQALKTNPNLIEALRVLSAVHLFSGETKQALELLAKARSINPRDEATLARIAVCLHAENKDAEYAAVIAEVEKHNPKAGVFYYELAQRFEDRKRYDLAEEHYRTSIKLRPNLPWAQNGLGLLHMRLGKEDEARKTLEVAFEADPFNVRVSNTLKVLDHLDKYDTLKTEHFHLKYDPKTDKVLAQFMAKYLEDIYKELAERFRYKPQGPILIEVFNKHEMFSGRVVALPDLHTIGACTGQMVAMVSPRDKQKVIAKPFNWVRVLRHEVVHVFNLDQTKFQVPHWFTEGLAVTYEGFAPPPRWHYLLAERVASGELMNLDTILLGFIRPSSPEEWQLAYLQSQLYVEYLTKTHGPDSVGSLLEAYRDGLSTDVALEKVCKVKKAEFEKGYREFLKERVKATAVPIVEKTQTFRQLKEARAKNPEDVDTVARLAERYYSIGDKTEARKLVDEATKRKPDHALARYVLARLHADDGQSSKAIELLQAAATAKSPDLKAVRLLGKLQFDAKNYDEAAKTYELGRKLEPYESSWLVQLARIYTQTKDDDKLIEVLKGVAGGDADDLTTRSKLAQMLLAAGNHAEAERYARGGLEIDVLDRDCQRVLEAALAAQNKNEELKQLRRLLQE